MNVQEQIEQINALGVVSAETANSSLTLAPAKIKENGKEYFGWSCYLAAQKVKINGETLPEVCQKVVKYITENRVSKEVVASNKPGADKQFRLP